MKANIKTISRILVITLALGIVIASIAQVVKEKRAWNEFKMTCK